MVDDDGPGGGRDRGSGCPDAVRRRYEDDGYVVLRQVVDPAGLAAVRSALDAQVDEIAEALVARGDARDRFADDGFATRLARLAAEARFDLRKWEGPLFVEGVHRVVTSPGLVAALTAVLGPGATFHGDHQVTAKLPGSTRTAFPWHQDTWYYGVEARHLHVVTVWMPLVPTSPANGCLRVIPGSHRWGLLPAHRDHPDLNVRCLVDVAARGPVLDLALQPGDVVLLSNLTFHGSGVNRSSGVRWSMDLGFSATAPRTTDPTGIPTGSGPDPGPTGPEGFAPGRPVATGFGPESDEAVAASHDWVFAHLRRLERVPLRLGGSDGPEPWPVWEARRARLAGDRGTGSR